MTKMDVLNALRERRDACRRALKEAETDLQAAMIAAAGIKVGDVVRDPDGVEFRVAKIKPIFGTQARVVGNRRNPNGDWSAVAQDLGQYWVKVRL